MFAIALRTLCAALVLVSLADERPLVLVKTDDAQAAALTTPMPSASVDDDAAVASEVAAVVSDALEYHEDSVYRIYRVTAYCDRGTTAVGVSSGVGQCAAPADIPFGTRIYIPELDRTFVVTDRTARRFRHNTVDLFIPDKSQCKQFGCQYLECEVTLPTERVRYGSAQIADAVSLGAG